MNTLKFRLYMGDPHTFQKKQHDVTLIDVDNDNKILIFIDGDGVRQEMPFKTFNNFLYPNAQII